MEIQQERGRCLILVFPDDRVEDVRNPDLEPGIVTSYFARFPAFVADDAVMVVFLLQIVYVNCVDPRQALYHHCHVMTEFRQRELSVRVRQGREEESPAILHGDGLFLRRVGFGNLDLVPGIRLNTENAGVIVVVVKQCLLEYLPDADRVLFLCPGR